MQRRFGNAALVPCGRILACGPRESSAGPTRDLSVHRWLAAQQRANGAFCLLSAWLRLLGSDRKPSCLSRWYCEGSARDLGRRFFRRYAAVGTVLEPSETE